ncbi:DELLA protein GAI1 [Bienertia sinuspersici]
MDPSLRQPISEQDGYYVFPHVIVFSMKQGVQWPALMQALALRPEGPPTFRLIGIGPPAADNSYKLQEVGWKAQFADLIQIQFEFVVFELHRLLAKPGLMEKVMGLIKEIELVIVTVVEQEALIGWSDTRHWHSGERGLAGFSLVHIGSNAFKQASMLWDFFSGGDGYGV